MKHPREAVERVRGRVEIKLSRARDHATHYDPTGPDWEMRLHEWVNADWPCPFTPQFDYLWAETSVAKGHDADLGFARAVWCTTLHTRPDNAVETGVARGITTKVILSAMQELDHGHLHSIDLPPIFRGWEGKPAELVDDHLKGRWTYLRGSSRRRLPPLLAGLRSIDVFIHDSLHTRSTMLFEMKRAWTRLREGGVLLVDDIDGNNAFQVFVDAVQPQSKVAIVSKEVRNGTFGIVVKQR